jgi:hypothetical protein
VASFAIDVCALDRANAKGAESVRKQVLLAMREAFLHHDVLIY